MILYIYNQKSALTNKIERQALSSFQELASKERHKAVKEHFIKEQCREMDEGMARGEIKIRLLI